jgi:hypothetical protein
MAALAYRIEAKDEIAQVVWDGTSDLTAETLLVQTSAEQRSERATAREFLVETLRHGPVEGRKVEARAEELDIKHTTLWRAKDDLGVISKKAGFSGGWVWELPKNVT